MSSLSTSEREFLEIAPYEGEAFHAGLRRLLDHPALPEFVKRCFPDLEFGAFGERVRTLRDVDDFQAQFISKAVQALAGRSSSGWSLGGLDRTLPSKRYLFVSNHRDILCDPAIFCTLLYLNGRRTPKICLGDNLLTQSLITDLVKVNKGVTVKRSGELRQLFRSSQVLSAYIQREIDQGVDSVWIAQREGRTKDGDDRTQAGILKMLALAGEGTFIDTLSALAIVPLTVSYEYDPCDALKARELHLTRTQGFYEKAPGEDVTSMGLGLVGFKGGIHFEVGAEIDAAVLARARVLPSKGEQAGAIAAEIDRQIHANYRRWPSNYVACDLLAGDNAMRAHYTDAKRDEFVTRIAAQLDSLRLTGDDRASVHRLILESYRQPAIK
ncbi:MAG: 1-acyl-sn-glycerol-3-phosphate acyltransferase [Verrucomicrobiota bacterium]